MPIDAMAPLPIASPRLKVGQRPETGPVGLAAVQEPCAVPRDVNWQASTRERRPRRFPCTPRHGLRESGVLRRTCWARAHSRVTCTSPHAFTSRRGAHRAHSAQAYHPRAPRAQPHCPRPPRPRPQHAPASTRCAAAAPQRAPTAGRRRARGVGLPACGRLPRPRAASPASRALPCPGPAPGGAPGHGRLARLRRRRQPLPKLSPPGGLALTPLVTSS